MKANVMYNIIVGCGLLVALFGLVMLIVAIVFSLQSEWINSFFDLDGLDGSLKNLIRAAQVILYIIGLYLLVTGALAFCVKKVNKRGCTCVYAWLLPPVCLLMLLMAIPILVINSISEKSINEICAAAANDNSPIEEAAKAGSRLLQAAEKAEELKNKISNEAKNTY